MKKVELKKRLAEILASDLIAARSLQFIHVRPIGDDGEPVRYGGLTIAYSADTAAINQNNSVVQVSLAWCNPNDMFDKDVGRFYAAAAFESGNSVKIPLASRYAKAHLLKELFAPFLEHLVYTPKNSVSPKPDRG